MRWLVVLVLLSLSAASLSAVEHAQIVVLQNGGRVIVRAPRGMRNPRESGDETGSEQPGRAAAKTPAEPAAYWIEWDKYRSLVVVGDGKGALRPAWIVTFDAPAGAPRAAAPAAAPAAGAQPVAAAVEAPVADQPEQADPVAFDAGDATDATDAKSAAAAASPTGAAAAQSTVLGTAHGALVVAYRASAYRDAEGRLHFDARDAIITGPQKTNWSPDSLAIATDGTVSTLDDNESGNAGKLGIVIPGSDKDYQRLLLLAQMIVSGSL